MISECVGSDTASILVFNFLYDLVPAFEGDNIFFKFLFHL